MHKLITVTKGDITNITVDAIVNAANTSLMGGGGVDGAIHRAGGSAILNDCRKIVARQGGCKVGEAVITTAGNLPATYVIHTVGPFWNGGKNNEHKLLANCYKNALQLAVENGVTSISFPAISTGIYRFPKMEAAKIAVTTVQEFLKETNIAIKVIFVCFDDETEQIIQHALENSCS